jgi:hypothetical protein
MSSVSHTYSKSCTLMLDIRELADNARRLGCSAIVQPMGDDCVELLVMGDFAAVNSLDYDLPIYL